ncbi:MAG: hypothetical protein O7H41_15765 [Planctomycetota bacterium]|nr:hypothetical protein [Planctomycetota bacterium]
MDQSVSERLDRLERQNRRLKLVGLSAVVLLGAALVMGQDAAEKPADVIKARSFQVVDPKGKVHAEFTYWPNEKLKTAQDFLKAMRKELTPSQIASTEDSIRKLQGIDSFEVGIRIYDTSGYHVGRFSSDYKGETSLSVGGRTGHYLIVHSLLGLMFGANQSAPREFGSIHFTLLSPGGPVIQLKDKNDQPRARLGSSSLVNPKTGAETKYAGSLVLFDEKGDVIWRAP